VQKIDDQVWQDIINEVDIDGNGEIDFKEFCIMMQKLIIEGESETIIKNNKNTT
jgi:calmodulin